MVKPILRLDCRGKIQHLRCVPYDWQPDGTVGGIGTTPGIWFTFLMVFDLNGDGADEAFVSISESDHPFNSEKDELPVFRMHCDTVLPGHFVPGDYSARSFNIDLI